jgi:DNA-binding NarL/FixJ family response regulator
VIRVLLADDHGVVREGIKRILADAGDVTVVGESATGPELLAQVATRACDVVIMDLSMPGMSGLVLLHEIRASKANLPVVVLSMHSADQYAVRTLRAGASCYLSKSGVSEDLVRALRATAAGRRYVTEEVAQALAAGVDAGLERAPHERLSNREFEVLRRIASGRSVTQIAGDLGLSVKTVSTFRSRVLEKLGLTQNAELVRYALRHGVVE